MQKLAKPNPADYGLTEEQYKRQRMMLPRLERIAVLLLPAFIWTMIFIASLSMVKGSPGTMTGVVGGGVAFVICSKAFRWVLHNLPVYKKAMAYDRELRRYYSEKAHIDRKGMESELAVRRQKAGYWKNLTDKEFKTEIARLYSDLGFEVETLTGPDDRGVDLIIRRDAQTAIVKCLKSSARVGTQLVMELYEALTAYGAEKAVLATVSGVTQGAANFIKDKPVEVLDLSHLIEWPQK